MRDLIHLCVSVSLDPSDVFVLQRSLSLLESLIQSECEVCARCCDSILSDVLLLWTCSEPERLFQGHRLLYSWFALILKALSVSVIHAGCAALCLPVLTVSRHLLPLFSPPFSIQPFFFQVFISRAFIFYKTTRTLSASCEVVLSRILTQNCAALHVLRPVKEVLCYFYCLFKCNSGNLLLLQIETL